MWYIMIPVNISDEAMEYMKEKIKSANTNTVVIGFEGYGWGGPKFSINLKTPNKDDELIYDGEVKLYIDKQARQFLNEVNLELKDSLFYGKYLAVRGSRSGGRCR